MKRNRLGRTDLYVSELCLGSMTWGTQNTEAEGHAQIDRALDAGINIIDTAELYPTTPLTPATQGRTEEIIGTWVKKTGRRSDVILATKVAGDGPRHIRGGQPYSAASIPEAVDGSLRRMQTDYIDLYQLHWPVRGSYMFRKNWTYDPTGQDHDGVRAHMEEVLGGLQKLVDAGKIRHIGLSNESAWGTAQWVRLSEEGFGPRMVSIQNEYSLLCRLFDTDLAELSHHEDVGLLSFSPLAVGLLTGKYQNGAMPDGSRMSIGPELGGRRTDRAFEAVAAYQAIADDAGLDLTQMALAWCLSRPFMTSTIFGATTMPQLETALGAVDVTLSDDVIAAINAAHKAHPMPY